MNKKQKAFIFRHIFYVGKLLISLFKKKKNDKGCANYDNGTRQAKTKVCKEAIEYYDSPCPYC